MEKGSILIFLFSEFMIEGIGAVPEEKMVGSFQFFLHLFVVLFPFK